ncbi:MAG: ParB N-terminal domain-containing protein, partial [Rhodoferax sp.]
MTTTPTPDAVAVELAHVAPSTLVMADNVRSNAADSLTKPFIASIRERGVLEPIIVDGTTEGVLTVRAGHRRTLAAIEAGTATVPVMIHTGEHARVDRLIDQIVENEHRAGLTNRDKIAAVEQLALEGLTEGQIAKRAALPKKDVAAAVRIAASTVAQFSDQLSLEQAAAMAEFDDNPDAVEKLLDAAQRGQFAHTLSRLQTDRIIEAATAEMVIRVEAAGLTATTGHLSWDGPA